jgi:hypothetical protein
MVETRSERELLSPRPTRVSSFGSRRKSFPKGRARCYLCRRPYVEPGRVFYVGVILKINISSLHAAFCVASRRGGTTCAVHMRLGQSLGQSGKQSWNLTMSIIVLLARSRSKCQCASLVIRLHKCREYKRSNQVAILGTCIST